MSVPPCAYLQFQRFLFLAWCMHFHVCPVGVLDFVEDATGCKRSIHAADFLC